MCDARSAGMPGAREIAEGLARIANEGVFWAIGWHFVAFAVLLALLFGWRPKLRVAALSLIAPLVSVSAFSFSRGNPFNGLIFAGLSLGLLAIAARVTAEREAPAPQWARAIGLGMVAFGLLYPHFLDTRPIVTYVFAAPVGLIPCPTLGVVVGFTLIAGGFRSRAWSTVVAIAGLVYGVFGAAQLGVALDWFLVLGAVTLIAFARALPRKRRLVRPHPRVAHA